MPDTRTKRMALTPEEVRVVENFRRNTQALRAYNEALDASRMEIARIKEQVKTGDLNLGDPMYVLDLLDTAIQELRKPYANSLS